MGTFTDFLLWLGQDKLLQRKTERTTMTLSRFQKATTIYIIWLLPQLLPQLPSIEKWVSLGLGLQPWSITSWRSSTRGTKLSRPCKLRLQLATSWVPIFGAVLEYVWCTVLVQYSQHGPIRTCRWYIMAILRLDENAVKQKTVEITKQDVALNNALVRAKRLDIIY